MSDLSKWAKMNEWWQHGKDFLVVVKHHTVTLSPIDVYQGVHRWAVYAFIYPKHRLFNSFEGSDMFQPATAEMPLHGGCSYLRWHIADDGSKTAVQVGCDYNHLHDEKFTHYADAEDAQQVFADADRLFDFLAGGGV